MGTGITDLSATLRGAHEGPLLHPQAVTAAVRSYQPEHSDYFIGTTFYLIGRKIKMACMWRVNTNAEMREHILFKK